jgi:hypothetical protein
MKCFHFHPTSNKNKMGKTTRRIKKKKFAAPVYLQIGLSINRGPSNAPINELLIKDATTETTITARVTATCSTWLLRAWATICLAPARTRRWLRCGAAIGKIRNTALRTQCGNSVWTRAASVLKRGVGVSGRAPWELLCTASIDTKEVSIFIGGPET